MPARPKPESRLAGSESCAGIIASIPIAVLTAVVLLPSVAGCRMIAAEVKPPEEGFNFHVGGMEAKEKLREAMRRFANRFSGEVQGAAARIVQESENLGVRRQAILWRLIAIQQGRDAAFQQDSLAALMDTWMLCVQMREFFETGKGKSVFGDHGAIALEASRKLEADIEGIAALVLPRERLVEARDAVARFAGEHPMQRSFTRRTYNSFLTEASRTETLEWIFDASLAPLRAIGGMDHTARAIHRVADVADEMNMVASFLPERVHLQTQLLLYDPEAQSALESFETIAASADRLSAAAEKLPGALSAEVTAALDGLEENRATVEETFRDVRTTLSAAETALAAMEGAARDLGKAGESWEGAVQAVHAMVMDFRAADAEDGNAGASDGASPENTGDGRPFDVREYGESAAEIGRAASELRQATVELRALLASEAPLVESAARGVNRIVDRAVIGCIAVIIALAGGALVYRVAAAKLVKKA